VKVKSFGCSLIFGSELQDDGYGGPYATPSKFSWPALVAQHLGYYYECYARAGSGNLQITDRLLNNLNEPALYIIGWTFVNRFDYNPDDNHRWVTILPGESNTTSEFYYKNLHSQYRDKLTALMNIKLVIDTLQQHQQPYIMTYIDNLIFDRKKTNLAIQNLQNHVRESMTDFEGMNFTEFTDHYGYPIGSRASHPLEQAHRAAADVIISQLGVNKIQSARIN